MKIKYLRWLVLAVVFVGITIGLVLNTNLGTLSSFGWQALATICPLGVVESALAAKTIFPRALIVLLVVVLLVIGLGKVFCAWICPVSPISSLINRIQMRFKGAGGAASKVIIKATDEMPNKEPIYSHEQHPGQDLQSLPASQEIADLARNDNTKGCNSNCSGCAGKRATFDSRHLILGGSLLSALIFGFPVFCLLCPIGLIFGTVIVVWQFIGFEDVSLSLLIYPLLLIVELLVLRKWCVKFCPLGALFSLLSLPNRFFKPVVNQKKCLRASGGSCHICQEVCPEALDPHYACSLHECSKCGLCKDNCPAGAISFALKPKADAWLDTVVTKRG